jgi:hypothetical protein
MMKFYLVVDNAIYFHLIFASFVDMRMLTSVFNARELAIWTLVLVGAIVALFSWQARSLLKEFLKLAFSVLWMRQYLLMVVYMAGWVLLFYRVHLWEPGLLKDTIKWLLFAATVTFFHINNFQKDNKEYLKVLKEIFTGSVLLEFFTDKFTFSYWQEMLLLPVVTSITLLQLLTEKNRKLRSAGKFFQRVLIAVGILFLLHLVVHGIEDFQAWFNLESLKELLLPVILTVLLMPYIFALSVYMTYGTQYQSFKRKLGAPAWLPYAKRKAFRSFFWDFRAMERWVQRLKFEEIKTKIELNNSILAFRRTQANEKSPSVIDPANGWSPYEVIHFMEPDFKTRFYDPRFDDKWMADSNLVYVGNSLFSNYFSYAVVGLELAACSLELELNITTPGECGAAHTLLGSYALELFMKSTGSAMPKKYLDMAFEAKPFKFNQKGTRVRLKRSEWGNTKNKSYDLLFTLRRGNTKGYD